MLSWLKSKFTSLSQPTSSLGSAIKNQDLTLGLEVQLAPSGSCSSSPGISLELEGMPLQILPPPESTSELLFTKEQLKLQDFETGSSVLPLTTGDQVP